MIRHVEVCAHAKEGEDFLEVAKRKALATVEGAVATGAEYAGRLCPHGHPLVTVTLEPAG